jgi:hypothetical protein
MALITRETSFTASGTGGRGAGKVALAYDTDRPLHVSMTFLDGSDDPAQWVFARDILARRATGLDCVRVDIDGLWTVVRLTGNDGSADIQILHAQVDAFLAATARAVPYGSEVADFDAELDQLLKDGAR